MVRVVQAAWADVAEGDDVLVWFENPSSASPSSGKSPTPNVPPPQPSTELTPTPELGMLCAHTAVACVYWAFPSQGWESQLGAGLGKPSAHTVTLEHGACPAQGWASQPGSGLGSPCACAMIMHVLWVSKPQSACVTVVHVQWWWWVTCSHSALGDVHPQAAPAL